MDREAPSPSLPVRGWDEQLRARGYRVTPQRQLLLEAAGPSPSWGAAPAAGRPPMPRMSEPKGRGAPRTEEPRPSEPKGRGTAGTEERRRSDEGRQRQ